MRLFRRALAATTLLTGAALAQAPQAGGWSRFTDPTEHAFTVAAPPGWQVSGGVKRIAPSEAYPWMTAVSPDGATELFIGDPDVPMFMMPNPQMGMREGSQTPGLHRPARVMRYRPGAEFAAMYGASSLPQVCSNVRLLKTEPFPELEDEIRGKMMVPAQGNTRLDTGSASFTCEKDGQRYSALVAAGTFLLDPTGVGGNWQAVTVFGFRAPQGHEAEAVQVLAKVRQSLQVNPQWDQALTQASQAEGEAIQRRNAAQAAAQPPAPMIRPYVPMTGAGAGVGSTIVVGPRCDDLQQRRICNLNDGHLVSSGGCLVCVN